MVMSAPAKTRGGGNFPKPIAQGPGDVMAVARGIAPPNSGAALSASPISS
jgi:hypothetical protein